MSRASAAFAVVIVIAARPAAADHTFKKFRETKVITLGYEIGPPFSFEYAAGVPMGYSIDLCNIVVAGLRQQLALPDLHVKWVRLESVQRIDAVVNGDVDMVCGNVTDTLAREERVDFSRLIYVGGGGMVVGVNSGISSIDQIAGKRIAVIPKTSTEPALQQHITRSGASTKVVLVNDHAEGIAAVESGEVDGYVTDRIVLIGFLANKFKSNLMVLEQYFSYEPIAFPMRNNDDAFRVAVNQWLSRHYRTGQMSDLVRKWLSPTGKQDLLLAALFVLNTRSE